MNIRFKTTLAWAALLVSCSNTVPPVNDNTTNTTTVAEVPKYLHFGDGVVLAKTAN